MWENFNEGKIVHYSFEYATKVALLKYLIGKFNGTKFWLKKNGIMSIYSSYDNIS